MKPQLDHAPLGTHERFIGFLIEHYAENFPLWLAPDQVGVITPRACLKIPRGAAARAEHPRSGL